MREGSVAVKDRRTGRTVIVRAGRAYLREAMRTRPGAPRLRMLLTAGVLAAAVAGAGTFTGALDPIENAALDRLFQKREAQVPGDVAVVAIDDVTFSDLERQWPFPRSLMAKAVDRLAEAARARS